MELAELIANIGFPCLMCIIMLKMYNDCLETINKTINNNTNALISLVKTIENTMKVETNIDDNLIEGKDVI